MVIIIIITTTILKATFASALSAPSPWAQQIPLVPDVGKLRNLVVEPLKKILVTYENVPKMVRFWKNAEKLDDGEI